MKLVSDTLAKRLQDLDYDGEYNYWLCAVPPSNEEVYLTTTEMEVARGRSAIPICAAPYLEQVSEWLREMRHTYIEVRYQECYNAWDYAIYDLELRAKEDFSIRNYKTYDQALEAGIAKVLEIMTLREDNVLATLLDTALQYSCLPECIEADTKVCDTDLDSLDRTCILMDMENLYGVHLDEELFAPEMTFREVANQVTSKLENKSKSES